MLVCSVHSWCPRLCSPTLRRLRHLFRSSRTRVCPPRQDVASRTRLRTSRWKDTGSCEDRLAGSASGSARLPDASRRVPRRAGKRRSKVSFGHAHARNGPSKLTESIFTSASTYTSAHSLAETLIPDDSSPSVTTRIVERTLHLQRCALAAGVSSVLFQRRVSSVASHGRGALLTSSFRRAISIAPSPPRYKQCESGLERRPISLASPLQKERQHRRHPMHRPSPRSSPTPTLLSPSTHRHRLASARPSQPVLTPASLGSSPR